MTSGAEMEAVRGELVPTGKLRVGVVYAPALSTFFVTKNADGQPYGPTVELGKALAKSIGADVEFLVVPNSGELADAVEQKVIDVAFMPVDDERKRRLAFGPAYFMIESTGLVQDASPFKITTDLNRAGVRVVGIANTTTIRNAARVLDAAEVVPVTSVGEAMAALQDGGADAVVLSRDVLGAYQKQMPGTRILDGALHSTGIAISLSKDRPMALRYASTFLDEAKSSGLVRRAFDEAGLHTDPVAPAGV